MAKKKRDKGAKTPHRKKNDRADVRSKHKKDRTKEELEASQYEEVRPKG